MRLKRILLILLSFSICIVANSYAKAETVGEGNTYALGESAAEKLQNKWNSFRSLKEPYDLSEINALFSDILKFRDQANIENLDEYSFLLLTISEKDFQSGKKDEAQYFSKIALDLSPLSPMVALYALNIAPKVNASSYMTLLGTIIKRWWYYPDVAGNVLLWASHTFLICLTATFLISCLLHFIFSINKLLISVGKKITPKHRGLLTPLFLIALTVTPVFFGPIWTIALWGYFLSIVVSKQKTVIALTGILLTFWGMIIPFREQLNNWLTDEGVQSAVSISSGSYSITDKERLKRAQVRRPFDPIVSYAYGKFLKRNGDLKNAESAFVEAGNRFGNEPWTKAEIGEIYYLQGNYEKADELYKEAGLLGLNSSAYLYNYSKIKFAKLETEESRKMFSEAIKKDPTLIKALDKGDEESKSFAEIHLPAQAIIKSLRSSTDASTGVSHKLLLGESSILTVVVGILFLTAGVYFIGRFKRKTRYFGYYNDYKPDYMISLLSRLIPGSSFILAENLFLGGAILSFFIMILLPLIGMPSQMDSLFLFISGSEKYILGFLLLFWVLVVQFEFREEREK